MGPPPAGDFARQHSFMFPVASNCLKWYVTCLELDLSEASGYLCVASKDRGFSLLSQELGAVPSHKRSGSACRAHEMACLLAKISPCLCLSLQEDGQEDPWKDGEAIVTRQHILSYTGMPQKHSQAFLIFLGVHLCWLDRDSADKIATTSQNHYYRELQGYISMLSEALIRAAR